MSKQYLSSIVVVADSNTDRLITCGGVKAGDKVINAVRMDDGINVSNFGEYIPTDNRIAVVVSGLHIGPHLISLERDIK